MCKHNTSFKDCYFCKLDFEIQERKKWDAFWDDMLNRFDGMFYYFDHPKNFSAPLEQFTLWDN
jgi:hypothetical protein